MTAAYPCKVFLQVASLLLHPFDALLYLPQVLPPLQLAPLSAKAPLPPLSKPSLQPLQAPASSQASSSAPAGTSSAQRPGSSAATQGRSDSNSVPALVA